MMNVHRCTAARQRGLSLLVVIVMMLVIALIAGAGATRSVLQEREAGYARDMNLAFQSAESALREAETRIRDSLHVTDEFKDGCVGGLCLPALGGTPVWEDPSLWPDAGRVAVANPTVSGVIQAPRYIIELMPGVPSSGSSGGTVATGIRPGTLRTPFRITAVGWGQSASTTIVLQATYIK